MNAPVSPPAPALATTAPPLCIDLDGTLLRSDLLVESAVALLHRKPWALLQMPGWLAAGKANLKRQIASQVEVRVDTLPFDERIVDLARREREQRRVLLCTASDSIQAEAVAAHLGCFDEVIASDGQRNLSGERKAQALVERFGERGFDYIGNDTVDLPVWRRARRAIVANAPASLAERVARETPVESHLPAQGASLRQWLRALRLHQWLKNLLIFLPLLAAHRLFDIAALSQAIVAFVAFSLCASSVYLLNDLIDLDSDRRHARKRKRPFAAGQLPVLHGLLVAPLLVGAAFALAFAVAPLFAAVLAGYYLLTLGYSFRLKQIAMVDVLLLAALYTSRIIGGTAATGLAPSFWLLAFSMFVFLSLAMLKRYTELLALKARGKHFAAGRGYAVDDAPLIASLGAASGYGAVLVLALYINSSASEALYQQAEALWLLCPLLLYWISRAWLIAHRGAMHDDPVVFAARDRVSQLILLLGGGVVLAAI